jgi:hypothetical protein
VQRFMAEPFAVGMEVCLNVSNCHWPGFDVRLRVAAARTVVAIWRASRATFPGVITMGASRPATRRSSMRFMTSEHPVWADEKAWRSGGRGIHRRYGGASVAAWSRHSATRT